MALLVKVLQYMYYRTPRVIKKHFGRYCEIFLEGTINEMTKFTNSLKCSGLCNGA